MPYRIVCAGEMAELTRSYLWRESILGPIEHWPNELVSTVNLVLASRYPMLLWWGPEHIQFYNDAYRPSLGQEKHPQALGQRAENCWREIWPIIGPEIQRVERTGEATWNVDRLEPIFRDGRMEEIFWTYSYIPVRDHEGRVAGVLVVCTETTAQVQNDRRLRVLLRMDYPSGRRPKGPNALARHLVRALADSTADVPFAMICSVKENQLHPMGEHGTAGVASALCEGLPIVEVAQTQEARLFSGLSGMAGQLRCDPWPEPVEQAFLQPIGVTFEARYVLILGISPRIVFDRHYESFFRLLRDRICQLMENEAGLEERRRAEEQRMRLFETVNQQRDLLSNIVESAPAGIAVLDSDLRIRWCNPYFTTFFDEDWSAERLLGAELRKAVPQASGVIQILEKVRDLHEPFNSAGYEHIGFARGITYWNWSAVPLATGEVLLVCSEVTGQVMARRKLEAVTERLHLAQKAAGLGTYYWDLTSDQLEWSPEFCDAVGLDQTIPASWDSYLAQVHPQDRPRLAAELEAAHSAVEGPLHISDHRMDLDPVRWVTLSGHIHLEGAERVIGTAADITARKHNERALEESRKQAHQQWAELEAIYRTAPIGLALFDPVEFRYLRLNRRQAEIVGLPAEQILGRTLTEIAPIDGLREMFEQVAQGTPVINALLEGELPMSPGEHRYWTVNYFPVYDADGSIQAISAASLEITAQKRAELALIQSEKIAAVGRLASSISHEINNPLEAVTNLLYLLRSEELSPGGHELLAAAEAELARVSQIATHTLRFHRQSTRAVECAAPEMIEPILSLYQGRMNSAGIVVEKQHRTDARILCFDGEIRQVLSNLIGNAVDAMWRGGRLRLRSQLATDWASGRHGLRITIADTGHGMNEATKRRLFEAFFTTKGIQGTGLGLWISAEIVRKHSGTLRFRSSRREGHSGTVFQLFLPEQPEAAAPCSPSTPRRSHERTQ